MKLEGAEATTANTAVQCNTTGKIEVGEKKLEPHNMTGCAT